MADRNAQIIIGLRNTASPEIRALVADNRTLIATLQQEGATLEQAERKMLSLAQAAARAREAQGDLGGASRILTAGLSTATQTTTTLYNAQTQLARVQQGGSSIAAQFSQGLRSGLLSVISPAALATAGIGLLVKGLNGARDAGRDALNLRETQNTLRALAGTTESYNRVIATARQQQILFGGSLQENIAGLQGLVITSRSTGAELNTLINLAQRLAVLDPAQGAEGARIALSEVLSGDPRSLARRYEIPLSALNRIKDESIPVQQRLAVLDQYLNRIGITSGVISGRVDKTAQSYRAFSQAADDARLAIGGVLADLGKVPTEVTTTILVKVASGIGTLANSDDQLQQFATQAFAGAKSFDDYARRVQFANSQLAQFGVNIASLSPTTYQYAQALVRTGVATDVAFQRAQNYGTIVDRVTAAQSAAGTSGGDWSNQLGSLGQRAAESAAKSDYNRQAIESLTTAYEAGGISAPAFAKAIDALNARFDASVQKAADSARGIINWANAAQGALAGLPKTLSDTSKVVNVDPRKQTILNFGNALGGGLKGSFDQQAQQAQRLAQLQLQNRLINAQTSAERIGILKQELAGTTDVLERQRIQNEIDQERASAAKGHTSELNKQLNLNERIYDSVNKQLAAQLDLSAAIIQDRQQRRDEQKEIDKANKVIGRLGDRTDARALDLRGRATDQRDLDLINQQQRQLRIQDLQATAGASIVNGKLYQSLPGGGGAQPTFTPVIPGPGGAAPGASAPGGQSSGAGGMVSVIVQIDGKTAWQGMAPYAWDELMKAIDQQKAQVGA